MSKVRVNISIDKSDHDYVTDAARAAGETFSAYLMRAAELRIESAGELTPEQKLAINAFLRAFDQ